MVVVEINMVHTIRHGEVNRPGGGHMESIVYCSCGWYEKGYSERDCQHKANEHLARTPTARIRMKDTWP